MRDEKGRFINGHAGFKPWLGKKRPHESKSWKNKISVSLKNKPKNAEHREAIRVSKIGNKNPRWKDGKMRISSGHISVAAPRHPFRNSNNRVLEHRLVMEKKLDRYLRLGEVVHHIDGDPGNNKKSNLYLTNKSGNSRAHHSLNKLLPGLLEKEIIYFNKERGIYEQS